MTRDPLLKPFWNKSAEEDILETTLKPQIQYKVLTIFDKIKNVLSKHKESKHGKTLQLKLWWHSHQPEDFNDKK